MAQVKVNILSHSSSPLTVSIRPAVGLFVDQSQRDHTLACSDLHSTPTMVFIPLPARGGEKEGEAGRWEVSKLKVREKCQQTSLEFERSCHVTACPAHTFNCTVRKQTLRTVYMTPDCGTSSLRLHLYFALICDLHLDEDKCKWGLTYYNTLDHMKKNVKYCCSYASICQCQLTTALMKLRDYVILSRLM